MTGFDVYEWFDPERGRTRRAPPTPTAKQLSARAHPLYAVTVAAIQAVGVTPVRAVFEARGARTMMALRPADFEHVRIELAAMIP